MATTQPQKSGSAQTDDVAIDVAANDLVLIGTDDQEAHHYHDVQRERIIVTSETHDEYTRDGSILVRRSLVAGADDIEEVIPDVRTRDDLENYITFVATRVDDREWDSITIKFLDVGSLLDPIRSGN